MRSSRSPSESNVGITSTPSLVSNSTASFVSTFRAIPTLKMNCGFFFKFSFCSAVRVFWLSKWLGLSRAVNVVIRNRPDSQIHRTTKYMHQLCRNYCVVSPTHNRRAGYSMMTALFWKGMKLTLFLAVVDIYFEFSMLRSTQVCISLYLLFQFYSFLLSFIF